MPPSLPFSSVKRFELRLSFGGIFCSPPSCSCSSLLHSSELYSYLFKKSKLRLFSVFLVLVMLFKILFWDLESCLGFSPSLKLNCSTVHFFLWPYLNAAPVALGTKFLTVYRVYLVVIFWWFSETSVQLCTELSCVQNLLLVERVNLFQYDKSECLV